MSITASLLTQIKLIHLQQVNIAIVALGKWEDGDFGFLAVVPVILFHLGLHGL